MGIESKLTEIPNLPAGNSPAVLPPVGWFTEPFVRDGKWKYRDHLGEYYLTSATNGRVEWTSNNNVSDKIYSNAVAGRTIEYDLLDGGNRLVDPLAYDETNPTDATLNGHLNWRLADTYEPGSILAELAPYYKVAAETGPVTVWGVRDGKCVYYASIPDLHVAEYRHLSSAGWEEKTPEPAQIHSVGVQIFSGTERTTDANMGGVVLLTDLAHPRLHEVIDPDVIGKTITFISTSTMSSRVHGGDLTIVGDPVIAPGSSVTVTATGMGSGTTWYVAGGVKADPPEWFIFEIDASIAGSTGIGKYQMQGWDTKYFIGWEEIDAPEHNSGGVSDLSNNGASPAVIDFGTAQGSGRYKVWIDTNQPGNNYSEMDNLGNANDDRQKLMLVRQWGNTAWYNARYMFFSCPNFEGFVSHDTPDFSAVTSPDANLMLRGCPALIHSANIDRWDISGFTSLKQMFQDSILFNGEIENWDISGITDIQAWLSNAQSFDRDLTNLDFSSITDFNSSFQGSGLSVENYDRLLVTLSNQNVATGVTTNFGSNIKHSSVIEVLDALQDLETTDNWIITDGGSI